jgi:hypothetical protein
MFRKVLLSFTVALFIAVMVQFTVFAHGHTEAGDYELVIGFHNAPAYQGEQK